MIWAIRPSAMPARRRSTRPWRRFGGFDHNEQTFRILTRLERRYAEFDGLNLTWESLEGIAKHNGPADRPRRLGQAQGQGRAGHHRPLFARGSAISNSTAGRAWRRRSRPSPTTSPITTTISMMACAPACSRSPISPMCRSLARSSPRLRQRYPGLEPSRLIHESIRRLIDRMVSDLIEETRRRLAEAAPRHVEDIRRLDRAIVSFSPAMRENDRALKRFLFERMYRHERVFRATVEASQTVRDLFAAYLAEPAMLPPEWRSEAGEAGSPETARLVADYIAGMTDRYAFEAHGRLTGTDTTNERLRLYPPEDRRRDRGAGCSRRPARRARYIACDGGAAARRNPWRYRDQRRDGAGQARGHAAAQHRRAAGRAPRQCRRRDRRGDRRAGLHQSEDRRSLLAGPHPRSAGGRARLTATSTMGGGQAVNVEYVSANPTGPLHIAHARGAVVGDALPALLAKAGFKVTREYYINDAGAQVDTLARSTFLRYREALGETIAAIPRRLLSRRLSEGCRPGAGGARRRQMARPAGIRMAGAGPRALPSTRIMDGIREDLAALGVVQEVFSSERAMVESGGVERALQVLQDRGLLYTGTLDPPKGKAPDDWEPRPQTLFKRDRVRRRRRPAAAQVGRQLDLFRRRHRLSLRQVPPRHADDDRRLGRRSCGLHQAHAGGGEGASPAAKASSTSRSASSCACCATASR